MSRLWRVRSWGAWFVLGLCVLATRGLGDEQAKVVQLTPRQVELLRGVFAPAYWRGDLETLVASGSTLLASANGPQLLAIEAWCRDQSMPGVPEVVAESRYSLALVRGEKSSDRPSSVELIATLGYFAEKLDGILERSEGFPLFEKPVRELPDLPGYRTMLWRMHVYDNELANHIVVAEYAENLRRQARRIDTRRLDEAERLVLKTDFADLAKRMTAVRTALHESELELRLKRLPHAVRVLGEKSDAKQRLFAAYVVATDGEILRRFFLHDAMEKERAERLAQTRPLRPGRKEKRPAITRPTFARAALNAPDLATRIPAELQRGQELAGDLTEKAVLLFDGLRWWERGRYGRGTEAFGLLKSKQAIRSGDLMTAIAMPVMPPVPVDPHARDSQAGLPEYQRRHPYLWTLDDRRLYDLQRGEHRITQEKLGERELEKSYFY